MSSTHSPSSIASLPPAPKPKHQLSHPHRHHHHHHSASAKSPTTTPTPSEKLSPLKISHAHHRSLSTGDRKPAPRNQEPAPSQEAREAALAQARILEREREKHLESLTTRLNDLSTRATSSSRRLDTAHASLLDSVAPLNVTLSQLQNLAQQSEALLKTFVSSTAPSLREEVEGQIQVLAKSFSGQSVRAEGLDRRVKGVRERVEELGKRMAVVRERVEGSESREREMGRRKRRRVGWAWGSLGIFGALAVVAVVIRAWVGSEGGEEASWVNVTRQGMELEVRSEVWVDSTCKAPVAQTTGSWAGREDPLMIFDEL